MSRPRKNKRGETKNCTFLLRPSSSFSSSLRSAAQKSCKNVHIIFLRLLKREGFPYFRIFLFFFGESCLPQSSVSFCRASLKSGETVFASRTPYRSPHLPLFFLLPGSVLENGNNSFARNLCEANVFPSVEFTIFICPSVPLFSRPVISNQAGGIENIILKIRGANLFGKLTRFRRYFRILIQEADANTQRSEGEGINNDPSLTALPVLRVRVGRPDRRK